MWDLGLVPTLFIIGIYLFGGAGFGFIAAFKIRGLRREIEQLRAGVPNADALKSDLAPQPDMAAADSPVNRPFPEPWAAQEHERDEPYAESVEAHIPEPTYSENDVAEDALAAAATAEPDAQEAVKPRASFEERLGSRWTVWVGGLALVLGGVFLVRYSIEAGLLTPLARILAGAVFALGLIGAGEWLRRRTKASDFNGNAYIPGVLTLAGTTSAFATIFSAYALYDLIGPAFAFILLAATAILTLLAALLHGPAIASYGLLASYVVPFLVTSDEPAVWPLAIYGICVSAAAYGVARLRLWRWFAIAAAIGSIFWGHIVAFAAVGPADSGALIVYDIATLGLAAFALVMSLYPRDPTLIVERRDWLSTIILFLQAMLVIYLLQDFVFSTPALIVLLITVAALLWLAIEWPVAAYSAISATILASIAYLMWQVPLSPDELYMGASDFERLGRAFANPEAAQFRMTGLLLAFLIGIGGLWGVLRSTSRGVLASAGVAGPLAILAIAYMRVVPFEVNMTFASMSLVLAVIFISALRYVDKTLVDDAPARDAALAAYAVGAVGALSGAMAIVLRDGWLPVGMSLLGFGTIWVYTQWKLPALPRVALAVFALTGLIIWYNPTIVDPQLLGTIPVFNALLYGYGVPSAMLILSTFLLIQNGETPMRSTFEALSVFAVLATCAVLIHHAVNGGRLFADADTLKEWSLHTLLLLSGSLALRRINLRAHSQVLEAFVLILGLAGFATIAYLHLFLLNPYFTGELIGTNAVFNLVLVAYLLPALMLCFLIFDRMGAYARIYRQLASILALALAFAWITLQVRAVFHRPDLSVGISGDGEFYAYSAAWLLFGVGLLLAGWFWKSRSLRLASSIFVFASVAKVFLFDMAGLDGIWRALSFIGLGFALIGIGMLYQKVLRASASTDIAKPGN